MPDIATTLVGQRGRQNDPLAILGRSVEEHPSGFPNQIGIALAGFAPSVLSVSQLDAEIDDYLTRYAATLPDFDSKAAASLWATPQPADR